MVQVHRVLSSIRVTRHRLGCPIAEATTRTFTITRQYNGRPRMMYPHLNMLYQRLTLLKGRSTLSGLHLRHRTWRMISWSYHRLGHWAKRHTLVPRTTALVRPSIRSVSASISEPLTNFHNSRIKHPPSSRCPSCPAVWPEALPWLVKVPEGSISRLMKVDIVLYVALRGH